MREAIEARLTQLLQQGTELVRQLPRDEYGVVEYYVERREITRYHAWLSAVQGLISTACPPISPYPKQVAAILAHEHMSRGVVTLVVQQVFGVLEAVAGDWEHGLLRQVEYVIAAQTFDEFLDHAAMYHKAGKKIEASVLGSAVLEDTVKKVAAKNGLATGGKSLEELIDTLVTASAITPVKAKRIKSWAGVRNHALHAEWDSFDIRDVGTMIQGVRELIDEAL